jgi:hypothetical protein
MSLLDYCSQAELGEECTIVKKLESQQEGK